MVKDQQQFSSKINFDFCEKNLAMPLLPNGKNQSAFEKTYQKSAMNLTDPSTEPISSPNEITRRNFMKKSALTVGAITLLGQGIGLAANCGSCPAHIDNTSDACTYVLEIHVVFTGTNATPEVSSTTYLTSGLQYKGTLKYKWNTCADSTGPRWTKALEVYSGGHRDTNSNITQGHDTCCPQGLFAVTPNSTGLQGFPLDTHLTDPERFSIQIHGPGVTTGCIAFKNVDDFNTFAPRLKGNNFPTTGNNTSCVHSDCKYKVTANVEYSGVDPYWTGPLPRP